MAQVIRVSGRPRVGCSMGFTLNMGNFQSARVDAWASMDVPAGKTVSQVFEMCMKEVCAQLDLQAEHIKKNKN